MSNKINNVAVVEEQSNSICTITRISDSKEFMFKVLVSPEDANVESMKYLENTDFDAYNEWRSDIKTGVNNKLVWLHILKKFTDRLNNG